MLTYQRDSQIRLLKTELLACTPRRDGHFSLELADTILYAEGGGQPADRGWIQGVQVLDVQRDSEGRVQHRVPEAMAPGSVEVKLDWNRRFDHMQQHSGQHLLTAIAQARLGLATTSFHMGASESHIDLDGPPIQPDALLALEDEVNAQIAAALPVHQRTVQPDELEALGARSRGLPEGHHGPVRLIEIRGLDLNPCGGTHVSNTAELGVIQLLHCARNKSASRLHFLVGGRVRRALRAAKAREQALNRLLQGGPEAHLGRIEKLLSSEKNSARALKRLGLELASSQAAVLAQAPGPLVHHHQPGGDMKHLRALASAALQPDDPRVLLLTAGDASGEGVFLLAGEADGVARLGPVAATLMEARGGGAGGRFQGKGRAIEMSTAKLQELAELLGS